MAYLGDSVYADYSTGVLELYVDNGVGKNKGIILDSNTLTQLMKFIELSLDVDITIKPKRKER